MNKTARLEQKLDGLVSLIKSGALSTTADMSPQAMRSQDKPAPRATTKMNRNTPGYIQPLEGSLLGVIDAGALDTSSTTPTTDSSRTPYEPFQVEAEEFLASFQSHKLRGFPFVHIPSTTTASHLKQERPFLWLCIMSISSNSTLQQRLLGSEIRQFVAQEVVVQLNKNIDLLLGILAFIGWYVIISTVNLQPAQTDVQPYVINLMQPDTDHPSQGHRPNPRQTLPFRLHSSCHFFGF